MIISSTANRNHTKSKKATSPSCSNQDSCSKPPNGPSTNSPLTKSTIKIGSNSLNSSMKPTQSLKRKRRPVDPHLQSSDHLLVSFNLLCI
jgi:hypothetical protein